MEMTKRQELAALEGWSTNKSVSLQERFEAAQQVIAGLRGLLHSEDCIVEVVDCVCE